MILPHRLRPLLYLGNQSAKCYTQIFFFSNTTSDSDPNSFTVSYLTNTCGFSLDAALKASKRHRFDTPHKPDSVISVFRTHGFSTNHIHRILTTAPEILVCDPTKRVLPKFHFLSSKGASPNDIVLIITKSPRFLRYSLQNHITPTFQLLKTFCLSDHKALSVLIACPTFIGDFRFAPNVTTLLDAGVTHSSIRRILCSRPSVLCSDLTKVIHEVKLLGFDPMKLSFTMALIAKRAISKSLWDAKVDTFKRWGWSEDEVVAAFKNQPVVMLRSVDKINKVMAFWVGRLGWDHSWLIAAPTLFAYSLEKRVVPRALVVQYLLSKGLVKKCSSLLTPFCMTDEMFLEKYVRRFKEETSKLLELYQGQGTC